MIDDQAGTTLTFLLCLESFQGWRVAALMGLAFFNAILFVLGMTAALTMVNS